MLARVTLVIENSVPELAVPRAAVITEGTRNFIFVESPDGRLTRQAVKTGRADDRVVEIMSGLTAGQKVVVQGAVKLQTAYASLR
jgi:membrane fusion protein (multidrug efflux system)